MADRRVKYILEVDYEGESVLLRAKDDLRDVDKAARESGEGLEASASGFDKLQMGALAAVGGIAAAQAALGAMASAARFAYDTLQEGAALSDARGDFEDLATSIGTTADAMQSRLATATAGLKTDAQLIAEASELMAVGLGLTEDEIVALSGVAAELDWDFQKLTDTLNTGSTRGLKEMGISIQEVKARTQELADAGMAADKAFTWAIIEAGEAKIDRVGKKSEEASGQIQILETAVANAQEAFSLGFAEGFAESLGDIAANAGGAASGLALVTQSLGTLAGEGLADSIDYLMMMSPLMQQMVVRGAELRLEQEREAAVMDEMAGRAAYYAGQVDALADAQERQVVVGEQLGFVSEAVSMAALEYGIAQEYAARQAAMVADAQERAAAADYARAGSMEVMRAQMEMASAAAEAWATYTGELTIQGGDYFTQFSQGGAATWDFAEALYGAADAAGAGVGPLSELGVELGLIDEATADAATAAAQQQTIMDSLAAAAAAGKIAWEDYADAVRQAWEDLNAPTPVVETPDMAERGFRQDIDGIQEEIGTIEVPLEIQMNNLAIEAAVLAAKGLVEGFTNPAVAYQAVMSMDISAVETGALAATGLINGIPIEKTVTVHFQATGQDILEQLRALGALP